MSTEIETKSAGVPDGATHQCTNSGCGVYYREIGPLHHVAVPRFTKACRHSLAPIAEAGPAPTTAAPAEQPENALIVGQKMADYIEEQMSLLGGASSEFPGEGEARELLASWRRVCPVPAEQPGKAADPRPARPYVESCRMIAEDEEERLAARPAQPQAPAEPWRSLCWRNTLPELLERVARVLPGNCYEAVADLCAAAEHFREHPPEVAAPLRGERDRLKEQLAKKGEGVDALARAIARNDEFAAERAKVAARDAWIETLEGALQKAVATAKKWHASWGEKDRHTAIRLRVEAGEETREIAAALGAPEGQPPAPPQELLGKEGGDGDLSAASFHAAEDRFAELKLRDESVTGWMWQAADDAQRLLAEVKRLRALVPPAEQAQPGGKGGGADELREIVKLLLEVIDHAESKNPHSPWCNGVHADSGACEGEYRIAEICADARNILNRSAPPRKAPQEDAQAWVKGWLAGRDAAADTAAFTHMRLGGPSRPSSEYIAREIRELPAPSSPGEQPFASTGAYKIPPATTKKEG